MKVTKGKIDFSKYFTTAVVDANAELTEIISKSMMEVIQKSAVGIISEALESEDTYTHFPVVGAKELSGKFDPDYLKWGHEDKDPLAISLVLDLNFSNGDRNPSYDFNLREIVADDIEMCSKDGSFHYGLGLLSAELRKLADEIDAARTASNSFSE